MKTILYLFVLSFSIAFLSCDVFENEQDYGDCTDYFRVVENMPILEGGLGALQKTVHYPSAAKKAGVEGRVTVQFIVNEEGRVVCPSVIRGIGGGCDQAAVDAVLKAKFTPGTQRGKPVRVQYSLPIVFRLEN